MYSKLLTSFCFISSFAYLSCKFEAQKDIFEALAANNGIFDFGFTFTYVGEVPYEFEYYLFIGQHFWRIHKSKDNEREVCIDDLLSDQHIDFKRKYSLAFSYLSDHMVQHSDELNLTNHLLLRKYTSKSRLINLIDCMFNSEHHEKGYLHEYDETNEVNEWIFDANHDNLDYLIGANFYIFSVPGFYPSVAFQPQSFIENEETDGPNFVFIEQNITDSGYERRVEVHSIIDETLIRNRTEEYGKYIPKFIKQLDNSFYINAILHSRLGPGGVDEGTPAVILIIRHEGVIKYCVTEEESVDESCKQTNLKQMSKCHIERDEL